MKNASASQKSATYELAWSLSIRNSAHGGSDPVLRLEYAVKALEELYIADRLWDFDAKQNRIPDPYGVYRFVRDGSLRLVFAKAPYPPNIHVGIPYRPLYSRVRAGETRQHAVELKLPVDEYSSMARDVNSPTVLEEVSRVFLVLGYALRSKLAHDPARALPKQEEAYIVYEEELIVSEMHVDKLPVKRRTGYIARFPLPGEPGPDPIPEKLLR